MIWVHYFLFLKTIFWLRIFAGFNSSTKSNEILCFNMTDHFETLECWKYWEVISTWLVPHYLTMWIAVCILLKVTQCNSVQFLYFCKFFCVVWCSSGCTIIYIVSLCEIFSSHTLQFILKCDLFNYVAIQFYFGLCLWYLPNLGFSVF